MSTRAKVYSVMAFVLYLTGCVLDSKPEAESPPPAAKEGQVEYIRAECHYVPIAHIDGRADSTRICPEKLPAPPQ